MQSSFYTAYTKIKKSPKDAIIERNNNVINKSLEIASTFEKVQEQNSAGSLSYTEIKCRLNSVIDPKTGKAFGDEYRKIIFDNFEHNKWLGQMYRFDNKDWLTINTSTKINASAYSIVKKCNNLLQWIDSDGVLQSFPCIFSRDISSEDMKYGSNGVSQIWGKTLIQVQRNQYTNTLKFNQRLLFDGVAFQLQQINNHISDTYLELYLFETQVQSTDDSINNVANGSTIAPISSTEIKILPDIDDIIQDETVTFNVYKYIDGVANSDEFSVVLSGISPVHYTLNVINDNSFSITNNIKSADLLKITCTNINTGESLDKFISLSGLW